MALFLPSPFMTAVITNNKNGTIASISTTDKIVLIKIQPVLLSSVNHERTQKLTEENSKRNQGEITRNRRKKTSLHMHIKNIPNTLETEHFSKIIFYLLTKGLESG